MDQYKTGLDANSFDLNPLSVIMGMIGVLKAMIWTMIILYILESLDPQEES